MMRWDSEPLGANRSGRTARDEPLGTSALPTADDPTFTGRDFGTRDREW